jgi:hypothetical protein
MFLLYLLSLEDLFKFFLHFKAEWKPFQRRYCRIHAPTIAQISHFSVFSEP